ncbi:MAG: hypothetical protein QM784_01525 [Polyangiaceae bacterium]
MSRALCRAHYYRSFLSSLSDGSVAGGVATIAMTAVMFGFQRNGWLGTMPPRIIVERCLRLVGASRRTTRRYGVWLSIPAHLGFGMVQGALHAALVHLVRRSGEHRGTKCACREEGSRVDSEGRQLQCLEGPLTSERDRPSVLAAVGFALAVWAVSYSGWIPAFKNHASADSRQAWATHRHDRVSPGVWSGARAHVTAARAERVNVTTHSEMQGSVPIVSGRDSTGGGEGLAESPTPEFSDCRLVERHPPK